MGSLLKITDNLKINKGSFFDRAIKKPEKNPIEFPKSINSFDELLIFPGFNNDTLISFRNNGWNKPTPIQRKVIPILLLDKEIIAIAPTGSGKTLAFLLPIILKIRNKTNPNSLSFTTGIQAVILCHTQELVNQIIKVAQTISTSLNINSRNIAKASRNTWVDIDGCPIMVETPKRLITFIQENKRKIHNLRYLVIDEADLMLNKDNTELIDNLFSNNIVIRTKKKTKAIRSILSATSTDDIHRLSEMSLIKPVRIIVGSRNKPVRSIKQNLLFVGKEAEKLFSLRQLIKDGLLQAPVLVFVKSKTRARILHRELLRDAFDVDSIHANQLMSSRNKTIEYYEKGKSLILIATNLIGRGIDISRVLSIVNYDLPTSIHEYINRVGRAGRCGRVGQAFTFYSEDDIYRIRPYAQIIEESH